MRRRSSETRAVGTQALTATQQLAPFSNVGKTNGSGAYFGVDSFLNSFQPQWDQFDNRSSILAAYLSEQYTYRCIESISKSITGQPFVAGPDYGNVTKVNEGSTLMRLFAGEAKGSPNPLWSSRQLLRYLLAQFTLLGRCALLKDYETIPGQLIVWPLMIQNIKPIPGTPKGPGYFAGFDYGVRGSSSYRLFAPGEIYYFYRPSLADYRQPESVLQAGQTSVSVMRMLNMFTESFFRQAAVPSTLVTTSSFAEDFERQAFREQFTAEFGGYMNAGRTAFLETEDADIPGQPAGVGAVNVQRLGATFQESLLPEIADSLKDDICLSWGVPRSVLSDSSGKTFANSGQDRRNYWIETLDPTAAEFTDLINNVMAPDIGPDVSWFDLSSVAELQPESLITAVNMVDLVANHITTRDEVRNVMGLAPWADVDPENTPFGPTPGEQVELPPGKSSPFGTEPKSPSGGPAPVAPPTGTQPVEIPAVSVNGRSVSFLDAARARREARHAGPDGHTHGMVTGHVTKGSVQRLLTTSLRRTLAQMQREAEARLSGKRGQRKARECRANAAAVLDAPYWASQIGGILEPVFGDRAYQLAELFAGQLGIALDHARPEDVTSILDSAMGSFVQSLEAQEVGHGA